MARRKFNLQKTAPKYIAIGAGAGVAGMVQGHVAKATEGMDLSALGEFAKYIPAVITAGIGMYVAETQKGVLAEAGTGLAAGAIGSLVADQIGSISGISDAEIEQYMTGGSISGRSENIGSTSENISGYEMAYDMEDELDTMS